MEDAMRNQTKILRLMQRQGRLTKELINNRVLNTRTDANNALGEHRRNHHGAHWDSAYGMEDYHQREMRWDEIEKELRDLDREIGELLNQLDPPVEELVATAGFGG